MNHDSDKTYKLPDWPEETEKPAETPRPRRRKRHVPEEPSDFWGKLRFRTGKKLRWLSSAWGRLVRPPQPPRHPGGQGAAFSGIQPSAAAISADAVGPAALRSQWPCGKDSGPPQGKASPFRQAGGLDRVPL